MAALALFAGMLPVCEDAGCVGTVTGAGGQTEGSVYPVPPLVQAMSHPSGSWAPGAVWDGAGMLSHS